MGKVDGKDKSANEAVNKRRKKRRKELDKLRRNVLEAKRKLDNKTQGFDNKGKKAGLKKICNRLLPSRKPQVGIFANGAKGAEIKRVNLSLNESDKARFEGDLQKVLRNGRHEYTESRSDALNEILNRSSAEPVDMEAQEFTRIPQKKLERKPVQNFTTERQSGKRKIEVHAELDGKAAKKLHSEVEDTKVEDRSNKVKSEWKNLREKKWKKSLFQNEVDDFVPIAEPGLEQLRFSPKIGKAKGQIVPAEPEVFLDKSEERQVTKKSNFNYEQLGRQAGTKYHELCALVRAENFDTCLRDIPHIDPLTKVKQSLINFYTESCGRNGLRNKVKPEMILEEDSSSTSSRLVHPNIHKNVYFDEDGYLERSKTERMNVLPSRGVCLSNLKNSCHREAAESSSARNKPLMTEATEVKKSKDHIPCAKGGSSPSSETSIIERNTTSLNINYDNSRQSFCSSDVFESLKINDGAIGPSMTNLDDRLVSPRLAGIPSYRKKTMIRYLEEVNNFEPPKKDASIFPLELSSASAESVNDLQRYHIGDALKKRETHKKQNRNSPKRMRGHRPYKTNIIEEPRNSLPVDCNDFRACSGLDTGNLPKIEGKVGPTVVNLGSASKSTLARIPSDRGEFMLRYLQDVNISEPRKEDIVQFRPEVFVVVSENTNLDKRQFNDPRLERHEPNKTALNHLGKNERHVPAILRKSQATKRNKKPNTADTILAKGVLEIGNIRWKTSNFKIQKVSAGREATPVNSSPDKMESSRKSPTTENLFSINSDTSANPESLNLTQNMSQLPETPSVINALYNLNEKALKVKRNFMDDIFSRESDIGEKNMAKSSQDVNFSTESKPRSPDIFCYENYTDNRTFSVLHKSRGSLNSAIFLHQQRSDAKKSRVFSDKDMISTLGDHESRRFPVFLKRKVPSSTQNRISYEEQHQGHLFPEKVVVNRSPTRRGISINKDQNPEPIDAAGLTFSKYPRAVQMASLKPVQLQNGGQQFRAVGIACNNCNQQVEHLQMPRCGCKIGNLQNEQGVRLPSAVYQNGMRKVVNRNYNVVTEKLGNNSMKFVDSTTFDVPNSQRIYHWDSSSSAQIPASHGSSCCGNTNSVSRMQNFSSMEPVQLFNGRVGFVLPKNEQELPFGRKPIDLPIITRQIPRVRNDSPVSSEDRNHSYKYIIDPGYPQAGYQWNQIEQSGGQIHQRIIQPAYNVTDAYRPQVPHTYFSTDS